MQVYKKRTFWAIYVYILVMLLTFVFLPSIVSENAFSYHPTMIFLVSLQMMVLLFVQISRSKSRIHVSENTIYFKNLFHEKKVRFDEIKGFRRLKWFTQTNLTSHIIIESKNKLTTPIKFNLSYHNIHQFIDWLTTNFEDLDQTFEDIEHAKALEDPFLGSDPIERTLKIKKSKSIATILNIAGFGIFLLHIFILKPHIYMVYMAIAIPLLAVIAMFYFRGLIKLNYIKRTSLFNIDKNREDWSLNPSIFSDVSIAILLPALSLFVIALRDMHVVNYGNSFVLAFFIASTLLLLIALITKEFRFSKLSTYGIVLFYFIFLFGYSFGSIVILRSIIDDSQSTTFYQEIVPTIEANIENHFSNSNILS